MNKCSRISKPMTGNSENSKSVEICRSSSNENNKKTTQAATAAKATATAATANRVFFFWRPRFFWGAN